MEDRNLQLEAIGSMLDVALEYGFEVEVIYAALKTMQENPKLKPVEAFTLGIADWIK